VIGQLHVFTYSFVQTKQRDWSAAYIYILLFVLALRFSMRAPGLRRMVGS